MTTGKLTRLAIWLIPAVLSLIALTKMPYGYYQFLRIVVFIAAAYLAHMEYKLRDSTINLWVILFVIIAILFNPLTPIHFKREVWGYINTVCSGVFIIHMIIKLRKSN